MDYRHLLTAQGRIVITWRHIYRFHYVSASIEQYTYVAHLLYCRNTFQGAPQMIMSIQKLVECQSVTVALAKVRLPINVLVRLKMAHVPFLRMEGYEDAATQYEFS